MNIGQGRLGGGGTGRSLVVLGTGDLHRGAPGLTTKHLQCDWPQVGCAVSMSECVSKLSSRKDGL